MRDTIGFGIDLGTTNSAIAVVDKGEIVVVKNNDGWEFTPSAVWIPKSGSLHVGRRAKERIGIDAANAHAEFKLEMGLDGVRREFVNARVSMTPQELSAEVLKSLRGDAGHQLDELPQAAVITVPAAFRLHQNNATSEAAALAGLGVCPLVQEPTAAAFAYGFQNESEDAYWMAFDFGGGTFDAAVVSTYEGELRVLDHAGDPHLGGKLIDWAVVERLLAPAAARDLGLSEFTRDNPRWAANFAKLKAACEEAKISLSRLLTVDVFFGLDNGRGGQEDFEFSLSRDAVDRVAEPFYTRAINLCRGALAKANLAPDDIDRLLLVGGTTLAPGLRERLADETTGLGIELDHSQDPITVVARGAAVFAGTVALDRPAVAPAAGEFTARLQYPRTTSLGTVAVAGKLRGSSDVDWADFRVTLENPKGKPPFQTPQITPDAAGTFVAEVKLDELTTSEFTILLVGGRGGREKVTPDRITITHWLNEPGGPVLTNSLGLSQADRTFAPILAKGARLPATARETFQTTVALRRSDADAVIRIPIVEGERGKADRNLQVAVIEIRPKDVRIDLPKGSDVEVTFEVDESRRVTVVADVPLVEEQFEAEIDLSTVTAPTVVQLQRALAEVEERVELLRESAERSGSKEAEGRLRTLEQERMLELAHDEVRAARSNDGAAAAADQRLRDIQSELDDVQSDVRLPVLLAELASQVEHCRELVGRLGEPGESRELAELERRGEVARGDRDAAAVESLIDRVTDLQMLMLKRDGTLEISVFHYFRTHERELAPASKARALIAEGEQAIANGLHHQLAGVNQRLRALLPRDAQARSLGGVQRMPGLGR
ncbi:Hsp70 family protein [Umezawaea sp. Da 62-37]|uniref:Hsp70 family protein n=1 Tax=Umezawaea sp. Da 62-37 TaxID=3075927 RepID=UPI0028F6EFB4|nr:Hsp70 family protein [Umezawaea sp. Da 62-37]WNV85579.1 Hsp70 family protein [Umezawaea sp. Da 62-37]